MEAENTAFDQERMEYEVLHLPSFECVVVSSISACTGKTGKNLFAFTEAIWSTTVNIRISTVYTQESKHAADPLRRTRRSGR